MTAVELVRTGVSESAALAEKLGINVPPLRGKLLRPFTSFSFVSRERQDVPDERFWLGCLAIQMVHEASICHDDVFDGGVQRRSMKTLLSQEGIGASVLTGDLYLTGAYRVAALTNLDKFLSEFIGTVEAMVRGESMQASKEATENHQASYENIVQMKSGELFGLAAALPGWSGDATLPPDQLRKIGLKLGVFYQMVDDFLDYCPAGNTGKPKLQDFHNQTWTFVLASQGTEWFKQSPEQALKKFFCTTDRPSIAERALAQIQERGTALLNQIRDADARSPLIEVVEDWLNSCTAAFTAGMLPDVKAAQRISTSTGFTKAIKGAQIAMRAQQLGPVSDWGDFFARNSRSFSFASRLFPQNERLMITEIYLFCRFTDNLVDKDTDTIPQAYETLDLWYQIAYSDYSGNPTGIPVADVVMDRMAHLEIPFTLVSELIEGMRMDVETRTYVSMEDLRSYTHRVASVVGAWITQAFGVRDSWVLERAHDLGHAMQLTNIVRDVGEDLSMGRIYLPTDLMASHNITPEKLGTIKEQVEQSEKIPPDYIALLEEIMEEASSAYDRAYEGIPFLPPRLRRAIAVAARVYRGIHQEVRVNGYNNLTRRAYTSSWKKIMLARKGLHQLRQTSRPHI